MLDRTIVKELLNCQSEDTDLESPDDIAGEQLVEAFPNTWRMIITSG